MGSVTLFGNGGAARAALVALKLVGISVVRIQARDMAEAMKLAVEFGLEAEPGAVRPRRSQRRTDQRHAARHARPRLPELRPPSMPAEGWVFDMVTDPRNAAYRTRAQERA